jgi:hypothetical protein
VHRLHVGGETIVVEQIRRWRIGKLGIGQGLGIVDFAVM